MGRPIMVTLELPNDWKQFRLPRALNARLQDLLDRQDENGELSPWDRREAEALVELNDILSQMKGQTTQPQARRKP